MRTIETKRDPSELIANVNSKQGFITKALGVFRSTEDLNDIVVHVNPRGDISLPTVTLERYENRQDLLGYIAMRFADEFRMPMTESLRTRDETILFPERTDAVSVCTLVYGKINPRLLFANNQYHEGLEVLTTDDAIDAVRINQEHIDLLQEFEAGTGSRWFNRYKGDNELNAIVLDHVRNKDVL